MKLLILVGWVSVFAFATARANEMKPRKYLCESDRGVAQIRGKIEPAYGFIASELIAEHPTPYPWGTKLVIEAGSIRVTAIGTGDPDLPQPTGPDLSFPTRTDPDCVFRSAEGDAIPKNVTHSVESCIHGTPENGSGMIIHPWFLEGRPIYDQVPKSGGFTLIRFKRVGRSLYDQFTENFGCTRLR